MTNGNIDNFFLFVCKLFKQLRSVGSTTSLWSYRLKYGLSVARIKEIPYAYTVRGLDMDMLLMLHDLEERFQEVLGQLPTPPVNILRVMKNFIYVL